MRVCVCVVQEKMAALQAELQSVSHNKTLLEKELQEIITLTSTELEEYQEKVMELEDEVCNQSFSLSFVQIRPTISGSGCS